MSSKEQRVIELLVKSVGDADIKRLGREMQAMRKEATASRKGIDSLNSGFKSMASIVKTAAGAFAAFVGVRALVGEFNEIRAAIDDIAKASQKLGVGVESLQKLRYAAELSGVEAASLDTAMAKLAKTTANLSGSTSAAAKLVKALGIEAGGDMYENMAKLADVFAGMPDGMQKTALAMELFGKSGAQLIPMLNQGSAAIRAAGDEAERLGFVISTQTAKAVEAFNDNLTRLGKVSKGVGSQLMAGMAPALKTVTDYMVSLVNTKGLFESWGEAIGEAVIWVSDKMILLSGTIKGLSLAWTNLKEMGAAAIRLDFAEVGRLNKAYLEQEATLKRITEQERFKLQLMYANSNAARYAVGGTGGTATAPDVTDDKSEGEKKVTAEKEKQVELDGEILAAIHMHTIARNIEADLMESMAASQEKMLEDITRMQAPSADLLTTWEKVAANTDLVNTATESLASGMVDYFSGAEKSFQDMLRTFLIGIAKMIAQEYMLMAITTARRAIAGYADGGVFSGGREVAFAAGGVVSGPTTFPMRGGRVGLMGERGPEAIMPLARTKSGALGVRTEGGGGGVGNVTVVNNTGVAATPRVNLKNDRMEIVLEAANMGAGMARAQVAADVRTGYGSLSRGIQSTYGLRRRG
jgi:hypothetical protein